MLSSSISRLNTPPSGAEVDVPAIAIGIGLACGSGCTGVWLSQKGVRIMDGVEITGQTLEPILKLT
jgi:hypothetical protein